MGRGWCLLDGSHRHRPAGNYRVVDVLVEGASARVHEEVGDRRHFEAELVGDGRLHVLVRSTRLLEDGEQRATLDVGEDESRFLVDGVDGAGAWRRVRHGSLVML